jgi:transcriptional regulator GlxA family with amidase domain
MALRIAIVAYQGVLADESHGFRDVFRRVPGAEVITVGQEIGLVAGPGGVQVVAATFRDVRDVDVIVVPGGLGSHRHLEIGWWIVAAEPSWVVTSSTGSALLAASGLLRGRTAATHWLAGPLLERHGAHVAHERIVVDEPFVTCSGRATTADAALTVIDRLRGPGVVAAVRTSLATSPPLDEPACESPSRYRPRRGRPTPVRALHAVPAAPSRGHAPRASRPGSWGRPVTEVELDDDA